MRRPRGGALPGATEKGPGRDAAHRLTISIEKRLRRALKGAVFETNGPQLWAQLSSSIGEFMQGLFERGALAGTTPQQAYFVRCGVDTMAQSDIEEGVVVVVVGFAPLKPARFVLITMQQMVGQKRRKEPSRRTSGRQD